MAKSKTTEPDDNIIEAGQGHNSLSPTDLKKYCEQVEALIEQRKDINADIKSVLEHAENDGFDKKTVKLMVKYREMDAEERQEQFDLRDAYLQALGLL